MNESLTFLVWNEPGKAASIKAFTERGPAMAEFDVLQENSKLERVRLYGPVTPKAARNPVEVAEIVAAANKARSAAEVAEQNKAKVEAEAALEKAEFELKSAKENVKKFAK